MTRTTPLSRPTLHPPHMSGRRTRIIRLREIVHLSCSHATLMRSNLTRLRDNNDAPSNSLPDLHPSTRETNDLTRKINSPVQLNVAAERHSLVRKSCFVLHARSFPTHTLRRLIAVWMLSTKEDQDDADLIAHPTHGNNNTHFHLRNRLAR
jgi:hypothetical protein